MNGIKKKAEGEKYGIDGITKAAPVFSTLIVKLESSPNSEN